jgi:hypothetical protein
VSQAVHLDPVLLSTLMLRQTRDRILSREGEDLRVRLERVLVPLPGYFPSSVARLFVGRPISRPDGRHCHRRCGRGAKNPVILSHLLGQHQPLDHASSLGPYR